MGGGGLSLQYCTQVASPDPFLWLYYFLESNQISWYHRLMCEFYCIRSFEKAEVPKVATPTFLGVTLDTRLTWNPHLEATRKLAIMEKLAGNTLGANSAILKQVYTGAVRPVIEYASTTWDTASKTNKSKLDRAHYMGLRIMFNLRLAAGTEF